MNRKLLLWEVGRWAAVCLTVLSLFLMAGTAPRSNVALTELEPLTAPLLKEGEAQAGDNRMLRRFYGLNPADYEGTVLYYPATNMGVEELLLVKLKDPAQGDGVREAIDARLASQKKSFDGYGVEQTELLNSHAVVEIRGSYVLFTVSENAQKIRQAFLDAL